MNQHLENAKRSLRIAESGDARKAAYRDAAEGIAAHKAESGEPNGKIAIFLGCSEDTVARLLRWRSQGYQADSPFLADGKATERARASHAKTVLRDPVQRRAVITGLTATERAEVVKTAIRDTPEVVAKVVEDKQVRRDLEDAEDKAARERAKARKEAAVQRMAPTPLSQFFWRLVGKLGDWQREMKFIRAESGSLRPDQRPQVIEALTELRDEAQRCIDVVEGKDASDVIEGTVHDAKALTA